MGAAYWVDGKRNKKKKKKEKREGHRSWDISEKKDIYHWLDLSTLSTCISLALYLGVAYVFLYLCELSHFRHNPPFRRLYNVCWTWKINADLKLKPLSWNLSSILFFEIHSQHIILFVSWNLVSRLVKDILVWIIFKNIQLSPEF